MVITRGCPHDKAQRNFTDTESRIIPAPGGKDFLQAVQLSGGGGQLHQVIVAARATNQTSDKQQAAAMGGDSTTSVQSPGKYPPMLAITPKAVASSMLWAWTRSSRNGCRPASGRVVPPAPRGRIPSHLSPRDRMRRKLQTIAGSAALRFADAELGAGIRPDQAGPGIPAVPDCGGLEKVNGEWSLIGTMDPQPAPIGRWGTISSRKARAEGQRQRYQELPR